MQLQTYQEIENTLCGCGYSSETAEQIIALNDKLPLDVLEIAVTKPKKLKKLGINLEGIVIKNVKQRYKKSLKKQLSFQNEEGQLKYLEGTLSSIASLPINVLLGQLNMPSAIRQNLQATITNIFEFTGGSYRSKDNVKDRTLKDYMKVAPIGITGTSLMHGIAQSFNIPAEISDMIPVIGGVKLPGLSNNSIQYIEAYGVKEGIPRLLENRYVRSNLFGLGTSALFVYLASNVKELEPYLPYASASLFNFTENLATFLKFKSGMKDKESTLITGKLMKKVFSYRSKSIESLDDMTYLLTKYQRFFNNDGNEMLTYLSGKEHINKTLSNVLYFRDFYSELDAKTDEKQIKTQIKDAANDRGLTEEQAYEHLWFELEMRANNDGVMDGIRGVTKEEYNKFKKENKESTLFGVLQTHPYTVVKSLERCESKTEAENIITACSSKIKNGYDLLKKQLKRFADAAGSAEDGIIGKTDMLVLDGILRKNVGLQVAYNDVFGA